MQSILMLINHPTDGATRGLTLRVRLLGWNIKKNIYITFYQIADNDRHPAESEEGRSCLSQELRLDNGGPVLSW